MKINKLEKTQIGSVIPRAGLRRQLYVDGDKKLNQLDSIIIVKTIDDFPAAVSGVITLEADRKYLLDNSITTSNRFVIPDTGNITIEADIFGGVALIYTGTDTMFTAVNMTGFFKFNHILILSPSGTTHDINGTAAGVIHYTDSGAVSADNLGTIKGVGFVIFFGGFFLVGTGIVLDGNAAIQLEGANIINWLNEASTVMFTLQGTIGNAQFNGNIIVPNANETVFDIKTATILTNGGISVGTIYGRAGTFFAASSQDQTTPQWKFSGNTGITDSAATVGISLFNNATNTTFVAINTPTQVVGTWVDLGDLPERFVTTVAGRSTYIGLDQISLQVLANPTSVTGVGTNKNVSFYFTKGNETNNAITAFADAGGGQVTVTNAVHGLSNNDRVMIRNTTSYNGLFTITNITSTTFEITATFVADDATGDWSILLENTKAADVLTSTTKASNTAVLGRESFVTNDFIELFIENNSDGNALLVVDSNITIGK